MSSVCIQSHVHSPEAVLNQQYLIKSSLVGFGLPARHLCVLGVTQLSIQAATFVQIIAVLLDCEASRGGNADVGSRSGAVRWLCITQVKLSAHETSAHACATTIIISEH